MGRRATDGPRDDRNTPGRAASAASEQFQLAHAPGAIVGTWVWDVPDRSTAAERCARSLVLSPELRLTGLLIEQVTASIHAEDRIPGSRHAPHDQAFGRAATLTMRDMNRNSYRSAHDRCRHRVGAGVVVDTIGDAAMATFSTRAGARARGANGAAMKSLNEQHGRMLPEPHDAAADWSFLPMLD